MKEAGGRRAWLTNVTAYTAGGILSSAVVGALLGALGTAVALGDIGRVISVPILIGISSAVLLRELGIVSLPLLQWPRQTSGAWAKVLPAPVAAALWGLDLGLVFTTWLTFAGPWLLAALAMLSGDVLFATVLFLAHWLGRSASVWLAPLIVRTAADRLMVIEGLTARRQIFRWLRVAGTAWAAVIFLVIGATGGTLGWEAGP